MTESTPIIFIAYSHKDKEHLEELRTFISPLIRNKKVSVWFDGEIRAGSVWDDEIKKALHRADIILLLVSPNSLNSDYFYEKEVTDALERHTKNLARVIPIILNPCLWDDTPLHEIQVLPKGAKPISEWQSKNSAWDDVARGIKIAIEEINNLKSIAAQKQIEAQKLKAKEEEEAKVKASQERTRIEKENKVKEFNALIAGAEKFEKEELWSKAESQYRKSLALWENPLKPAKEKILAKITYCISKQNQNDRKEVDVNTSITSNINEQQEAHSGENFTLNHQIVVWVLLGIAILWAIGNCTSLKQRIEEAENVNQIVINERNTYEQYLKEYSSKFPIIIDDISATIVDKSGNQILESSSHELTANSITYLTPVIEYRAYSYGTVNFLIKIIQPDGTVKKGEKSPPEGSYEWELSFSPQPYLHNKWAKLGGWGGSTPNYPVGYYKIEVWYQNYCLGANTIVLK
jgi:TIR domain